MPIHVFDKLNKRIKSNLRYSNSSNYINSVEDKYEYELKPIRIPNCIIVFIALSSALLLSVLINLLYRKIKKKQISQTRKTKFNRPIREVWANPDIGDTNNIITFDEEIYTNDQCSNERIKACEFEYVK